LWETKGKTPAATLASNLSKDIREYGDNSRFYRAGKNVFGLNNLQPLEVTATATAEAQSANDEQLTAKTLSFLDAAEFILGTLVVGDSIKIRMAIQAKRWKNNVQAPIVQQVRGSLVRRTGYDLIELGEEE
jgi:hypothetical protein